MADTLLDAGLVEQLLRIVDANTLVASQVQASLEILEGLAKVSQRAREMIWMVANSIKDVQIRLEEYQAPASLAKDLLSVITRHDFVTSGALGEEL